MFYSKIFLAFLQNIGGNEETLNGDEITILQFNGGQLLYYALGEVN